jgi:hypothetical protein
MAEMVVQQLLLDAGVEGVDPDLVSVEPQGFEVPADWSSLGSAETYLGYGRTGGFASPDDAQLDEPHAYPVPSRLSVGQWAPSGTWTMAEHAAVLDEAPGRIVIQFQARDVNLVMTPSTRGTSVRFRVLLDGRTPTGAQGFDVDDQGNGTLVDPRLYQLVPHTGRVGERRLEIEFLDAGVEAYCFTFG